MKKALVLFAAVTLVFSASASIAAPLSRAEIRRIEQRATALVDSMFQESAYPDARCGGVVVLSSVAETPPLLLDEMSFLIFAVSDFYREHCRLPSRLADLQTFYRGRTTDVLLDVICIEMTPPSRSFCFIQDKRRIGQIRSPVIVGFREDGELRLSYP